MRHMLVICVLVLAALAGCGDDGASSQSNNDPALVGTWRYQSDDILDKVLAELDGFLRALGSTEEEIALARDDFANESLAENSLFDTGERITLAEDGTWRDDQGDTGTWSTDGDRLTLTNDTGNSLTVRYALAGRDLVWTWEVSEFVEQGVAAGELDTTEASFFGLAFQAEDTFTITFRRDE